MENIIAIVDINAIRTADPTIVFMPIIVAKRYNPLIKAFYDRLIENRKPKMVALIAAMRKLLTILNVMVREGKKWNENEIVT